MSRGTRDCACGSFCIQVFDNLQLCWEYSGPRDQSHCLYLAALLALDFLEMNGMVDMAHGSHEELSTIQESSLGTSPGITSGEGAMRIFEVEPRYCFPDPMHGIWRKRDLDREKALRVS